ncbi:MAG: hypothetical protein E1N59_2427 [Puniceicoccaceae bacterium 5H]|nr:MAG: hypothetical protein E1N59_2427 [Puniceicoccaceae bacterium 5H]
MKALILPLGLIALLSGSLSAQASYRVSSDAVAPQNLEISVSQNPDARELAQAWVQVLDTLDLSNNVRITVVRGDTKQEYGAVVEMKAVEQLLVVTLATHNTRSGRHRVVVRADEVLDLSENP